MGHRLAGVMSVCIFWYGSWYLIGGGSGERFTRMFGGFGGAFGGGSGGSHRSWSASAEHDSPRRTKRYVERGVVESRFPHALYGEMFAAMERYRGHAVLGKDLRFDMQLELGKDSAGFSVASAEKARALIEEFLEKLAEGWSVCMSLAFFRKADQKYFGSFQLCSDDEYRASVTVDGDGGGYVRTDEYLQLNWEGGKKESDVVAKMEERFKYQLLYLMIVKTVAKGEMYGVYLHDSLRLEVLNEKKKELEERATVDLTDDRLTITTKGLLNRRSTQAFTSVWEFMRGVQKICALPARPDFLGTCVGLLHQRVVALQAGSVF